MPIKRKNAALPLSVFIICKNEEDRISTAIKSVIGWANEVIVVDSGSTDKTVKIAKTAGATNVVFNEWQGYGKQKSYAESLCKNQWVLNLDADEEASPLLKQEISNLNLGDESFSAYEIGVKNISRFTNEIRPFTHEAFVIRLYNTKNAQYSKHPIHDSVIIKYGKCGRLKNSIRHRSFKSYVQAIEKINFYTSMQAEDMLKKNRKPSSIRIFTEPFTAFLKAYIINKYIFWGMEGFIESIIYSFSRTLRLAKARELHHFNKKK
jgi:glycosyltransferase involved in cell wall biosynthesis